MNSELHENCNGCARITGGRCIVYLLPKTKWRPQAGFKEGHCPMATHRKCTQTQLKSGKYVDVGKHSKQRVGQQKQKKGV